MPSFFPLKSEHVLSAKHCFYCIMLSSDGADGASHAKNKLYLRKTFSADKHPKHCVHRVSIDTRIQEIINSHHY